MLLLSIETSSRRGSVALCDETGCLREEVFPDGLIHGREITARIDHLLRETGRGVKELSAIAVSIGPGSFTGIRVGVTAAKSLAYALEIPVVTESSLLVCAANVAGKGRAHSCLVVLDARQGAFFWGLFDLIEPSTPSQGRSPFNTLQRRFEDAADEPSAILRILREDHAGSLPDACVIGEGAVAFLEKIETCSFYRGDPGWDLPQARVLGEIALERAATACFDSEAVHRLEPRYLRATEAERKLADRGEP